MSAPRQDWYDKAADAITRGNSKNLFEYCNEHNLAIRKQECDAIIKTPEWQAALRAARNKFYKELAGDPTRSRNTAVGQLLYAVQRLLDAENYDKAVAALSQLFKVEGWNKEANQQVNIFQDLSSRDFAAIRDRLKKSQAENPSNKLDA